MIYIVEDDANIRQMEGYALKNSGYEVTEFSSGAGFLEACSEVSPELVVLDIMLPGEDGMVLLKRLKRESATKNIPVVMVTARSTELDAVKGLDAGADDYIAKPFGIMEFVSRIKAVLRRTAEKPETVYRFGDIGLDDEKRIVTAHGEVCELTYKEYELLKYLIANRGIVLTRDRIMDRIWGMDFGGASRTVDMHIKTLRQKLGDSGAVIKTVRNVGYKIED